MEWYRVIAIVMLACQMVFLLSAVKNYRYALREFKKSRTGYRPCTAMIVPCKGLDTTFHENIGSFFAQDYDNYTLFFVVADTSDPAYPELCQLKETLGKDSKAKDVRILVAGTADKCSQKIHNMLCGYENIDDSIEALAFADSDIYTQSNWLSHIVHPLRHSKSGVSSGYRWFVPQDNTLATLALSALNAKIAQLLGNTRFNQVWGGSMALRVDTFRQLGLEETWSSALSDDYAVSCAVKEAGRKVTFVPGCLVASQEKTTWPKLVEFVRRQLIITRINRFGVWLFGLLSCFYSVAGSWGMLFLATRAGLSTDARLWCAIVSAFFFMSQGCRALLRQTMIRKILPKYRHKLKWSALADISMFWLWSILFLLLFVASAFGRTIRWRGIKYRLSGLTQNKMIKS